MFSNVCKGSKACWEHGVGLQAGFAFVQDITIGAQPGGQWVCWNHGGSRDIMLENITYARHPVLCITICLDIYGCSLLEVGIPHSLCKTCFQVAMC